MKKQGFTLAEVLITLGIIGVVAALTAPSLVLSSKNEANAAKLAVAVSNLENAFTNAIASEGVADIFGTRMWTDSLYTTEEEKDDKGNVTKPSRTILFGDSDTDNIRRFQGELARYLNVSGTYATYKKDKYSPTSLFYGERKIHPIDANGGTNSEIGYSYFPGDGATFPIVLKSGAAAHMRLYSKGNDLTPEQEQAVINSGSNYLYNAADVFIDVNGAAEPNTYGRDIFYFQISEQGILYPAGGLDVGILEKTLKADGSSVPSVWYEKGNMYSCTDGDYGSDEGIRGLGCTGRLVEENYKMNY